MAVDVLAYGGVAPGDQLVDGATTLDVTGLEDAAACTVRVLVAPGTMIRCAALHAQVLLKLVAWQARGRTSSRDAADLALLLDASHQGAYEDEVWCDETALVACGHVPDLAGPFRLGTLIARDFRPRVIDRVVDPLDRGALSALVNAAVVSREARVLMTERLDALLRGISAGRPRR